MTDPADFVIEPLPRPVAEVAGTGLVWPIRRVLCVGRNYADHAREMGADPQREAPFFFGKPADAVIPAAGTIPFPPLTDDLQHEIELVVAVGREVVDATAEQAAAAIFGYAVGVDLTRRDLQNVAKELRRPWDAAKGFDASAPLSPIVPRDGVLSSGRIWLTVDGELRQEGDIADMIWGVAEVIAAASTSIRLMPGDLIFTGTPAGVSTVHPGQTIAGGVDGVGGFSFELGLSPRR